MRVRRVGESSVFKSKKESREEEKEKEGEERRRRRGGRKGGAEVGVVKLKERTKGSW